MVEAQGSQEKRWIYEGVKDQVVGRTLNLTQKMNGKKETKYSIRFYCVTKYNVM